MKQSQNSQHDNPHPGWRQLGAGKLSSRTLFQTSLMAALISGVYEGEMTFDQLKKHGNFGLGTFNELDGEMVACEGAFYQLRSDSSARAVTPDQKSPFAVVTFFEPEHELRLSGSMAKEALLSELERTTETNLFTAIQIAGVFDTVTTRTVQRQVKPFPPLITAAEHESVKAFKDVKGTLVGFRTPSFAQGIGVAGFHLHFLREDKQAGGHVLDFTLRDVVVQIAQIDNLHLQFPLSGGFLKAQLAGPSVDAAIQASEG